jgi:hypothetical protein
LGIGPVDDVTPIRLFPLLRRGILLEEAHGEAQKFVNGAPSNTGRAWRGNRSR